jgi:transposase
MVDGLGNLVRFSLWLGQHHDSVGMDPSLEGIDFSALLADEAFDSDTLRLKLDRHGALAVIPPKAGRKRSIHCDFVMYRWRHVVENFFCNLKQFRRMATRYDRTDQRFAAMIHLASTVLALK